MPSLKRRGLPTESNFGGTVEQDWKAGETPKPHARLQLSSYPAGDSCLPRLKSVGSSILYPSPRELTLDKILSIYQKIEKSDFCQPTFENDLLTRGIRRHIGLFLDGNHE